MNIAERLQPQSINRNLENLNARVLFQCWCDRKHVSSC